MSGFRQFIKDKPTKRRIKLQVLADSSNSFTVDFIIYIGRAAGQESKSVQIGLGIMQNNAVRRLMAPTSIWVTISSWTISNHLLPFFYWIGVSWLQVQFQLILETRRSFPVALKNSKEWVSRKERGCMRWVRTLPAQFCSGWMIRSCPSVTTVGNANDHVQVSRKQRVLGEWTEILVQQPQIFQTYNLKMNAGDRSDQILSASSVNVCVWWKTLFSHIIDIAVVNSFVFRP